MIYPADEGEGQHVFAVGSVIVKSRHRHQHVKVDYSYADAKETQAVAIAKSVLKGVRQDIYFAGKINGRAVLIQERLPGMGLTVAEPYLSDAQKQSFKEQAREILRQLHTVKAPSGRQTRQHIVPDPDN
ncbi:uncharacterized protein UV8b_03455 [Ustilaginoidea virens]|uniref:Uncharacterized protein n=1 Tax=Ustilaginoidea virens TaxID=1159556 RepID=A0A1B5KQU5_USTVR|nr:uncharacterized protein UV8b_03455 [Ustilaginoidea virens]QUC19214.1 hypothetical protein UV8b_03455 [Ustilaginoidea virens]GAO13080.1 hypothetical protein UVI_02024420 [Ustilaginoidea virens]